MSHKSLLTKTIVITVIGAALTDLFVSVALGRFHYSPDGNKLQTYFSYGVSTVRKLGVHTGLENGTPHNIAQAGWNNQLPEHINEKQECSVPITFYGMSFSNRVSNELAKRNPCFHVRQLAGPGSPLSHSYFMATKHAGSDNSEYAVLGILASALPKNTTMAHFNSAFEFPGAHMYPRYSVSDSGELDSTAPPAESLSDLKQILTDKRSLTEFKETLSENDYYFNNLVFSYPWLDYSNIAKMLRRSYAQKNKRKIVDRLFKDGQFTNHQGLRQTSIGIVKNFVRTVQENGQTPIILLINDKGYDHALDELFQDTLEGNNIRYVSSSTYIDGADLSNFLADGHFTKENDRQLAVAIEQIILP